MRTFNGVRSGTYSVWGLYSSCKEISGHLHKAEEVSPLELDHKDWFEGSGNGECGGGVA